MGLTIVGVVDIAVGLLCFLAALGGLMFSLLIHTVNSVTHASHSSSSFQDAVLLVLCVTYLVLGAMQVFAGISLLLIGRWGWIVAFLAQVAVLLFLCLAIIIDTLNLAVEAVPIDLLFIVLSLIILRYLFSPNVRLAFHGRKVA